MNRLTLHGRLTRDPELNTTQSGTVYARFSVAVDRRFKGSNGERQADFFSCVAWNKTAEIVGGYFSKGKEILLSGEMQSRKYQAKDGTEKVGWEVNVAEVEFCGSKHDERAEAPPPPQGELMNGATDVSNYETPF